VKLATKIRILKISMVHSKLLIRQFETCKLPLNSELIQLAQNIDSDLNKSVEKTEKLRQKSETQFSSIVESLKKNVAMINCLKTSSKWWFYVCFLYLHCKPRKIQFCNCNFNKFSLKIILKQIHMILNLSRNYFNTKIIQHVIFVRNRLQY